jgi:hypothetical protein
MEKKNNLEGQSLPNGSITSCFYFLRQIRWSYARSTFVLFISGLFTGTGSLQQQNRKSTLTKKFINLFRHERFSQSHFKFSLLIITSNKFRQNYHIASMIASCKFAGKTRQVKHTPTPQHRLR